MNTKVVFDHRGRVKYINNVGPVEVRIIVGRKPYYINTGVRVKKREFLDGVIINRRDAKVLNKTIDVIVEKVGMEVLACIEQGLPIDVAEIRRNVFATKESDNDFLKWVADEIEGLSLSDGTMKHYRSSLRRLDEFGGFATFADITVANIYKFDRFLRRLKKPVPKAQLDAGVKAEPLNQNTIHNYHKDLKALLARAVRVGMLDANPYDKLHGEFVRKESDDIDYLSEDEIERFESLRPEGGQLEVAWDLFTFQMYTGLAYVDTQEFDIRDYKNVDGRWINIGSRVKTGVPFVSQLLPQALAVVEKYGMRTPKITNQVYNRMLKVLGMQAGIHTPLHSHVARHTFATRFLSLGAKIENVSAMLGHTNIRQTQRYARVLAQSVQSDFDLVSSKLAKMTTKNQ